MNTIEAIITEIQDNFAVKLVGEIQAFGGGANGDGTDIDFFVRDWDLRRLSIFLEERGFILGNRGGLGLSARKCLQGKLYHLDFAATPYLALTLFPDIRFKSRFYRDIWNDRDLEKFFRYVTRLSRHRNSCRDKYERHVEQNFHRYGVYLSDTTYLSKPLFKKGVDSRDVLAVMRKDYFAYLRVFPIARLLRMSFVYLRLRFSRIGTGEVIAFVGADGAGKSTTIDILKGNIGTHAIYMGDVRFVLQPLYLWMYRQNNWIAYGTYLLMYIENWFRYGWIFYKKFKGDIVLADRWPGYNQNLFGSNKRRILHSIIYALFPKPDRFIFLSAPPHLIRARKPELTIEQIDTSQKNLRSLLRRSSHVEVSTESRDVSLNQIIQYVLHGESSVDISKILEERRPTVVEFVGMYASGKTTTARVLADALCAKGYVVKTNIDMWEYLRKISRARRWRLYLSNLQVWHFIVFHGLPLFRRRNEVSIPGRRYYKQILGPTKDAINRQLFLEHMAGVDFVVFDEGFIYSCTDILWKYHISPASLDWYLRSVAYLETAKVILFENDVSLSERRTGARASTSLIDRHETTTREAALRELLPYFTYTNQSIQEKYTGTISADPKDSVDVRVRKCIDFILSEHPS